MTSTIEEPARTNASHFATGHRYKIGYCNTEGSVTDRTIRVVKSYSARDGRRFVRAWCELRDEERTFRVDRILWASPVTTLPREREPGGPSLATRSRSAPTVAVDTAASRGPNSAASITSAPRPDEISVSCSPPAPVRHAKGGARTRLLVGSIIALCVFFAVERFEPAPRPVEPIAATVTPETVEESEAKAIAEADLRAADDASRDTALYYRGFEILRTWRAGASFYTVTALDGEYKALHEARIAINAHAFRARTGLVDREVEAIYAAADSSLDGYLSWEEIQSFQRWMDRNFAYRHNKTALPPIQFLEYRGGDCEDWALFTCGLLRFWGLDCYVAGYYRGDLGHAVAFAPALDLPGAYQRVTIPDDYLFLPEARGRTFVPIDYAAVGGFSNATEPGMRLTRLWIPERIYGTAM